ncbi:cell differentiation family, Rcd1-like-domain-containing protein [Catenaria anguillulae PL171]|uniref:Cell differentiation family, Rcd1-like-domain-containing protein n=1 Tax=Catenaria anguillulae PL171 TaxID=765915 RepID=A0A1Y2HHA6_9FUNG|nr:cell differentiation family, Rcd1-like-domain-containing protein [Catenaria anguillulae PL171]
MYSSLSAQNPQGYPGGPPHHNHVLGGGNGLTSAAHQALAQPTNHNYGGAPQYANGGSAALYANLLNPSYAAAAASAADMQQQHFKQQQQQMQMGGGGGAPGFGPGSIQQQQQQLQQQQQPGPQAGGNVMDESSVHDLVVELLDPKTRERALLELSKTREQYDDLALILWHSFGVMSILIQEIIAVYPLLAPPTLSSNASNRVCNALALLQCVASHPETRGLFLSAHIPLFLYPFLNTTSKTRPFEYLRLTSLGVIGALVKNDSTDVITFLLSTEIIPLCLRIMETGSELSKIVAIFIVQKILLDDIGLSYICQTYERFYAVGTVLGNMVTQLVESQSVRLLKHVVRCYLRLSDNPRFCSRGASPVLADPLRDSTFSTVLKDDATTKRCLAQLLINLSDPVADNRTVRMNMQLG